MRAESERTAVIQGERETREAILGIFARARRRLDISASSMDVGQPVATDEFVNLLTELKERGVRARLVTDIKMKNVENARLATQFLEVRHLDGLKATFAVTDDEYLTLPGAIESGEDLPLIYSNAGKLVEQHQFIFERLWGNGEPAENRITTLESGSDRPEFEVIRDPEKIRDLYLSAVKGAKKRVLLLLPTAEVYGRAERAGVIGALFEASRRGAMVRLQAPIERQTLEKVARGPGRGHRGAFAFRSITAADSQDTVTILVVDDKISMAIDEKGPGPEHFEKAVGMATLITQVARMRANVRFFERSWMENEVREAERAARMREESSRRRAELMQDILTHDIRNFNQVTRLNAELLADQAKDEDSKKRIFAILKSVDGSSRLIERTKKLGSILSASTVNLRPTGLKPSIERSMSLVRKGSPKKNVVMKSKVKGRVLADGFLDEVFTNLFSNSVKYTNGEKVRIAVDQENALLQGSRRRGPAKYWKISVSDWGRGIPDSMKRSVFSRYLETARGSGLGMSIVHALVTDRYGGRVEVKDREDGDHTKGTTVELWLLKA